MQALVCLTVVMTHNLVTGGALSHYLGSLGVACQVTNAYLV